MSPEFIIGDKKIKVWQLIALLVLLLAIPIGVYLSQRSQIFKPRASGNIGEWVQAFEIRDAYGKPIECDITKNPPECITPTLDVNVKVVNPSKLQ